MKIKTIYLILLCVFLSGCVKLEKEYFYKGENKEVTIRLRMYKSHNLTLLVDTYFYKNPYEDARQQNEILLFENCNFFDDSNWECTKSKRWITEGVIQMVDGNLNWITGFTDMKFTQKDYKIRWE